ncbi:MAG: PAS domain-containing sensor histidine kinase [Geminicoccaceae bacterium]
MNDEPTYFETALAQGFVEHLRTALWIYDFDEKRVVWANQAALDAWQAETLEELRSRNLGAEMSRSVDQRLSQYREDFIAHDAAFSELWTLYPRGKPMTMHVIFRGFRLEDRRMAMLCEGIETEAGAPETLRSADALLHTSVMISLFRGNGEQLYRNPASRIAYGGACGMLDDQFSNIADLVELKRRLADGDVAKQAVQMRTAEGTRWHDVTAFRCKDAVTGQDSVLVSEIDISEMKAAEQRLRDFAEVSSDWFWEMDASLRFTWFSDNVEDKTSVPAIWHYGKTREEILAPDNDQAAVEHHLADLKARRSYRDFRMLRRGPEGDLWLSSSGKPIFDQDGNFLGYRGNGADVSERVEAEQKIAQQRDLETALAREREINGLQRQFVSMVSHEFRTPLAIIDGNAQRLMRRLPELAPERTNEALQKVRRSVKRLTELMESVLNAARLEEGQITYEPGTCNLTDLIREICDSYLEIYPDRPIQVDIDKLPDQIVADPKLIHQVVSNLTSNAVKYSPAGTTIWVKGQEDERSGCAIISVRDEGVGIPEAEVSRLCDRFFRASTSTGVVGTGIGLHLAQHFVALHGGTIEVESREGEGSTFTVRLPLGTALQERDLTADTASI